MPLVTAQDAAEVLGVDVQQVYNLASRGQLARHAPLHAKNNARPYDLDEVETRSLARLGYHATGHPYWANAIEVATFLEITRSRVWQLFQEDRLPYVTAPNGRRYVRRHQLDVIANARGSRAGRFG